MNQHLKKYLEAQQKDFARRHLSHFDVSAVSGTDNLQSDNHLNGEVVIIQPYGGNSRIAHDLSQYFSTHKHSAVYAVIVHGSVATSEETEYSDFDGIIITNQSKLKTQADVRSLGELIRESVELFYYNDPLQHHGWNFIDIKDLNDYPDAELPLVLLNYSRVLYPSEEIQLKVCINKQKQKYSDAFYKLTKSILLKMNSGAFLNSFYSFKNFCSEIMLLPAVYYQAKNYSPVYKKDSFELARVDFSTEQWQVIDTVSKVRSIWNQSHVAVSRERYIHLLKFIPGIEFFRAPVPQDLKLILNDDFANLLPELISKMAENINAVRAAHSQASS